MWVVLLSYQIILFSLVLIIFMTNLEILKTQTSSFTLALMVWRKNFTKSSLGDFLKTSNRKN